MNVLTITILAAVFFLVGAGVAKFAKNSARMTGVAMAVAAGTMGVLICGDFLPEMLENELEWWQNLLLVGAGVAGLKILDHFVPEHGHEHDKKQEKVSKQAAEHLEHIGFISLLAIVAHNFLEGAAMFAVGEADFGAGMMMAAAVGLHNIPMGMMIEMTMRRGRTFGVLTAAGATILGGILMMTGIPIPEEILVGLAMGMAIYIEAFELVPHVVKTESRREAVLGILVGVAIGTIGVIL